MDYYLLKYILNFLKLCNKCNKYHIFDKSKDCHICKIFYCFNCNNSLKQIIGYTNTCYCLECYNYFINDRITC